ncbi:MAG: hypothetical protein SF182_11505 [Deltaproteobacteria bacterium]|nr:hypothetical protein [Deltaproteobacteria bacterium]
MSAERPSDGRERSDDQMPGWRQRIVDAIVEFYLDFLYLAFFLVAFAWYRRLILAEYDIHYLNYWVPLIEAAVLAKVIMLGDLMRFGHGLERRPLLVPTLWRTFLFSLYVAIFSVIERTLSGLLHGKGLGAGLAELADKGRYELLAQCIIVFCAFVPFFAFKELEVVLGKEKLRDLFWRRGAAAMLEEQRG